MIFLLLSNWLNSSSIQIQTSNQKALDCTTDSIQFLIQDYLVISSNQQLIVISEQQGKVNGCPAFCIAVEHQHKEQSRQWQQKICMISITKHLLHGCWTGRRPAVYTLVLYLLSCFWLNFHKLLKRCISVPAFPFKSLIKLQSCK